ncbi:protein TsetseEP-like [Ceratitis capitata]|uniref:protein TsetseEP-like n=1 Tax=Ceratitis capitata TaxID=7213 RepID=UPI00032A18F6|nr:protein TsetseEP-like [Ceratitis capitata]
MDFNILRQMGNDEATLRILSDLGRRQERRNDFLDGMLSRIAERRANPRMPVVVPQPEPGVELQPEPEVETPPQPEPEVEPQPEPDVETQPEVEPQPQPEVELPPQAEVEPQPQGEPQPEVQAQPQGEPQPEVQAQPEPPPPPQPQLQLLINRVISSIMREKLKRNRRYLSRQFPLILLEGYEIR